MTRPAASADDVGFSFEFLGSIDGQPMLLTMDGQEVFRGIVKIPAKSRVLGRGFPVLTPRCEGRACLALEFAELGMAEELELDTAQGRLVNITVDPDAKRVAFQQWEGRARTYE